MPITIELHDMIREAADTEVFSLEEVADAVAMLLERRAPVCSP